MHSNIRRSLISTTLCLIWGASIVVGFQQIEKYEQTPGRADRPRRDWPAHSKISFTPGRFNIVMLAHPRCPCTRASLDELQELLGRSQNRVAAQLLFLMPSQAGLDWKQTDLWRRATAIPELKVHADEQGAEARQFGALTSGHVVVYDGDGKWLFSGGLTNARGRSGDSRGAAAIWRLINHETPQRAETPVFGCPLFSASSGDRKETVPCR